MKRRELITLLGGAAAAWPLAARAQQAMRVIGFMGGSTASSQGQWAAAFAQRLRGAAAWAGKNPLALDETCDDSVLGHGHAVGPAAGR